jgi:hypothetical protein
MLLDVDGAALRGRRDEHGPGATITLLVLLEKFVPAGWRVGCFAGMILVAWGAWVISTRDS